MFELLVPATPDQLQQVGGDRKRYDLERRPALMVNAVRELQEAGVEPDIWKIEGLDRREDCLRVAETARRDGPTDMGCIVLGRGEDETHVHTWLATAADVPGFIGFAVGRTTFWDPLITWCEQKSSRDAAAAEIARRYRQWVDVFEKAHASRPSTHAPA
jgi:myo-inositol catabolism protein IolC